MGVWSGCPPSTRKIRSGKDGAVGFEVLVKRGFGIGRLQDGEEFWNQVYQHAHQYREFRARRKRA